MSETPTLVPAEVTRAVVAAEVPAVDGCAARWGWQVEVDLDLLTLRVRAVHPIDGKPVHLVADMSGYKAVPPAWQFTAPDWTSGPDGAIDLTTWPQPGTGPRGSIFHGKPLICAPWNRLAYGELGGVHDDWSGITSWLSVGGGVTHATTLADMLAIIRTNLADSPGRMA